VPRLTSSIGPATRPGPRELWLSLLVLGAGLLVAYWGVLRKLVLTWSNDETYSHGVLILPLAVYFAWERREELANLPRRPSLAGLALVAIGFMALVGGTVAVELFVARASLLMVLAGCVLFLGGWAHLRLLAFPLAFLVLMIPVPAIVFNQIAFPLQLIASHFGEAGLRMLDIPVLREGNVIVLANATLLVAEACSGIRSLVALLTLSIVYTHFAERRPILSLVLILMTVPIAIVTNGARVAAIGVAARYYGVAAAEGIFHTFSGWLIFVVAFALLLTVHRALLLLPTRRLQAAG
jgi:exosortase